jgi:D-alanyl-D-alanine dipeptidase
LQSRLYNDYKAELVDSSSLDGAELEDLVAKFVSMPSSDPTHPSPHLTGGAVDLTLTDLTGTPLDMGSSFDELTERSYTDYYGTTSDNSHTIFRERREMLLAVMHGVGFTNFESEWWHFDYGDQFWAEAMSRSAVYGKVSPV